MTRSKVEIAVPAQAELGESPLWSPDEEVLYWADIEGKQVHRYNPASDRDETRPCPWRPGAIVLTDRPGRLLIAADHHLIRFDWDSGLATPWVELEEAGTGNRMNDGRTDPAGRFWVGSMYDQPAVRRASGRQYRIEGGGSFTVIRTEVGIPNGLAFDPERNRMYWADTFQDMVWRYDYDLETGQARNETPFVDFSGYPGRPDGACVDAEGCYWIAAVAGGAVLRFTPDGRFDRRYDLPASTPTMPAFGGPDLSTLYVTSLRTDGRPGRTDLPDHRGDLFVIDAGVTGRPETPFAGTA